MSEVGRKSAGTAKVVRGTESGPTGPRGKLTFVDPNGATPEQVAAVERAGGRIKRETVEVGVYGPTVGVVDVDGLLNTIDATDPEPVTPVAEPAAE